MFHNINKSCFINGALNLSTILARLRKKQSMCTLHFIQQTKITISE